MVRKTHTEAQARYDKIHRRVYGFRLHNEIDSDIIDKLASVPSMQGYIKQLIRDDISRTQTDRMNIFIDGKQQTYHIKPEYYDLWLSSEDARDPKTVVLTEQDIIKRVMEWESTKINELREQLIPD